MNTINIYFVVITEEQLKMYLTKQKIVLSSTTTYAENKEWFDVYYFDC